jgi:hypothetical protein
MSACPYCGKAGSDFVAESDDGRFVPDAPKPGDVVVCFGCLQIARFAEDSSAVKLTLREVQALLEDPTQRRLIRRMRFFAARAKEETAGR